MCDLFPVLDLFRFRAIACIIVCAAAQCNAVLGAGSLGPPTQISTPTQHQTKNFPVLHPDKPVTRTITGAGSHSYKIKLRAKQAVVIVVTQRGVDLKLVMRTPEGVVILDADSPNGSFGREEIMIVAEKDGDYELEIKPYQEDASSGTYTATITTIRNASANDLIRFGAFKALSTAGELSSKGERTSYEEALKKYDEALKSFQRIRDTRGQAVAMYNLGYSEYNLENLKASRDYFLKALPLWQAVRDTAAEANILSSIGLISDRMGEPKTAVSSLQRALHSQRRLGDRKGEADTLNNLGVLYKAQGQYQLAIQNLSKALSIFESVKNPATAELKASLGAAYADYGRYQKALALVGPAIPTLRTIDNKEPLGSAMVTLGDVNFVLGNRSKAQEHYTDALATARSIGNRGLESRVLNNIGRVELLNGSTDKSRELFESALSLGIAIGAVQLPAYITNNLGETYLRTGQPAKALEYYAKAMPALRSVKDPQGEARTANYIGNAHLALGQVDQAISSYADALDISRRVGDNAEAGTALANLMNGWMRKGNSSLAIAFGKEAVNAFQSTRHEIKSLEEELQKSFLAEKETHYRLLAELLIEQGNLIEAERVIAMLKEEEYTQFLRSNNRGSSLRSKTINLTPNETTALARYKEYQDRITAIAKEFGTLQEESQKPEYENKPFPKQARLDELDKLLAIARSVFAEFIESLKLTFNNTDARLSVSELKELLKSTGAKQTAIVSSIVGTDQLSLIVTTADIHTAHKVEIGSRRLNELVAEFRAALRDPDTDPRPAGKALYDLLVKPIEKDLKGIDARSILWSLDGTLRYIPPAALWDGERYLTQRFANGVITFAARSKLRESVLNRKTWRALGVGTSKKYEDFPALDAVPDELDCIVTDARSVSSKPQCRTGVINGRKYIDETFTKASFKKAMGRYSFVHVASHFYLQPGDHTNSYLLLGGGDDRRLLLSDVNQSMFRGVELLTLSACNTAVDTERSNGVEIEGFGTVAQDQGAKAVLATLWPVADTSTRDLMVKFYSLYSSADKTSKAEALRLAQLSLLRDEKTSNPASLSDKRGSEIVRLSGKGAPVPFIKDQNKPYAHPFYWAPFVLIGNWK